MLSAVVAASVVFLTAQAASQVPAGANRIVIDVQVRRGGQPVDGLSAGDFVLRDSGVAQAPELVPGDAVPVNVLLALDTSASVRGPSLDHVKAAARAAFAALRPADQGALVTFSHNVALRAAWTSDRAQLNAAIDGVTAQGSSALTDAAFAAMAIRARPGSRTLVLLFTDGDDSASWLSAADVVQVARRSDAVVSSVTLTAPGNTGALISNAFASTGDSAGAAGRAQIAQWLTDEPNLYRGALLPILALETGGETVQISETATLAAAFADVITRYGRRYVLSYTPTGVPAAGWHLLDVEVKGGGEVTTRSGYQR